MIEKLKSLGESFLGIIIFIGIILLGVLLLNSTVFILERILPFLTSLTEILILIFITVLIPMAFFKKTREVSVIGMFWFSYGFGLILWFYSASIVYIFWGFFGLIIGLMLAGVGVLPIAFLAILFAGEWSYLGILLYMAILTYGSRILAIYIATKIEERGNSYVSEISNTIESEDIEIKNAEVIENEKQYDFLEDTSVFQKQEVDLVKDKFFCTHCGKELSGNPVFCGSCGNKII